MKKILVSFGDSRMKLQSERLQRQAEEMNIYDKIYICNENDLSSDFCEKYAKELVFGSRGFGYWCWKPQIIHQILQKMQDGDILQYIDIGCHLNPKGREQEFVSQAHDYSIIYAIFLVHKTCSSGIDMLKMAGRALLKWHFVEFYRENVSNVPSSKKILISTIFR